MNSYFRRIKSLHDNRYIYIYITRIYKYNIYPKLFKSVKIELVCINHDGVKYELVYKKRPKLVIFNDQPIELKVYNDHRGFIWLENKNGVLSVDQQTKSIRARQPNEISEDSIIIVSDRYEKAGDNGEYFYQWILNEKPQYHNVFFAISKKSIHYSRLQNKGFKLLDMDSKKFRDKYQQADVIVSSVFAEYIENHRTLRYKQEPKSRFICLQHGILFRGEDFDINAKQKINYFLLSTEIEKIAYSQSKIWFNQQIPVTGMSRMVEKFEHTTNYDFVYMPSWTDEAYKAAKIEESKLFKSITTVTASSEINQFLNAQGKQLTIVIHPQISQQWSSWLKLQTPNIRLCKGEDIDYQQLISSTKLLITDFSSVFIDGLFRQTNIIFYQPDKSIIKETNIDYSQFGMIKSSPNELLAVMKNPEQYQIGLELDYNLKQINQSIWKLVTHG